MADREQPAVNRVDRVSAAVREPAGPGAAAAGPAAAVADPVAAVADPAAAAVDPAGQDPVAAVPDPVAGAAVGPAAVTHRKQNLIQL